MRRVTRHCPVAAAIVLMLVACGDDVERVEAPAPAPAAASAAAPAAAAPAENRVQAMINEIDRQAFTPESRDPFSPPRPTRSGGPNPTPDAVVPDCNIDDDPLGETDLSELALMALITGTPVPRAMFTANRDSQAVIVSEGAKIGPDCTNRITDIRDNEVVVTQMSFNEAERVETVLILNEERLAAEIIDIR